MRGTLGSVRAKLLVAVIGAGLVAMAPAHSAGGRTESQGYVDARVAHACAPDAAEYEYSPGGTCFRVQPGDDYLEAIVIEDETGDKIRGQWQAQYKPTAEFGPVLGTPQPFCGSWSGQESLESVEFILVRIMVNMPNPTTDPLGAGAYPECSKIGGTLGQITATFATSSPSYFGLSVAASHRL